MADVRGFRGIHYNRSMVNDLGSVICPPYDIISPQMQQQLYERSPFNFVRIEFTRETPTDTEAGSKYNRAAASLDQWLKQGVLKTDETPAIYMYDQYFSHQGRERKRRSLIAIVKLEEWDRMVVRPHEGTLSQPKQDRLNLLRRLRSNTSPVLTLYEDQAGKVADIMGAQEKNKPVISIKNVGGEGHVVWAMTDLEAVNQIHDALIDRPIYIADGHHRYESALNYRREQRSAHPEKNEQPYDFVMMTMVEFNDPGLVILPAHRMVRGMSPSTLNDLGVKLPVFFTMEEIPFNSADVWQRVDKALAEPTNEARIVQFGPTRDKLIILTLRNFAAASRMMPGSHSEVYKKLDVSMLDHVILEKLLGITREHEDAFLTFSYDKRDAVNTVLSGEFQLAFLLNPVKASTIKAIADVSDRMPRKSSYFFPKVPSGLVFYRLI